MDLISVLYVLIGSLIIVSRAPLIVAPSATVRFYMRCTATDSRVRAIALMLAPLAVAIFMLPPGDGTALGVLQVFGWLFVAATLWLLLAPTSYRGMVTSMLGGFEGPENQAFVRIVGIFAVSVGIVMIYVGASVV